MMSSRSWWLMRSAIEIPLSPLGRWPRSAGMLLGSGRAPLCAAPAVVISTRPFRDAGRGRPYTVKLRAMSSLAAAPDPARRPRRPAAGTRRWDRAPRGPHRHRQVAAGAGGQRAQQVDLGEHLQVVAGLGRAGLHEVLVVVVQAGDLEHVEHVVHVQLGQAVRRHRARQVRVAVEVEVLAGQQLVHVGVAARAQQVVHAAAVAVDAVAGQRVLGDGGHGAQVGQRRPEAVMGADVGLLQLARARGPHAFARVVQVPHVEVRHLRAFQRDDAEHVAGRHLPGEAAADRHHVRFDQLALRRIGDQER